MKPRSLSIVLCLVVGVSCKKAAPDALVGAGVARSTTQLAAPPREVRYERKRVVGALGLPAEPILEVWTPVSADRRGVVYEVSTTVDVPEPRPVSRQFRYGRDGLELLADGRRADDGTVAWSPWDPPLVLLPADASATSTWGGTHSMAGQQVDRTCEVLSRAECAGEGLVVVCDATWPEFRLVTRDHFCRDVGWSGYESLVIRDGHPDVRTWTEGVRRVD